MVTGPMPGTLRSRLPNGLSRKRCVRSLSTQLLFQDGQDAVDPALDDGERALAALQLGRPHLNDLSAASDQGFQFTGGSRDQRLRYDTAHLTEVGDHCSVDAVSSPARKELAKSRT